MPAVGECGHRIRVYADQVFTDDVTDGLLAMDRDPVQFVAGNHVVSQRHCAADGIAGGLIDTDPAQFIGNSGLAALVRADVVAHDHVARCRSDDFDAVAAVAGAGTRVPYIRRGDQAGAQLARRG